MKQIKLFEQFFTEYEIHELCNRYYIKNYSINSDMSIDVQGDVDMTILRLERFPLVFNIVSGDFYCYDNFLTTLINSPIEVGGCFKVHGNDLTSLKHAPKFVGTVVNVRGNPLPQEVLAFNDKKSLFKYQEDYAIWNLDGTFNKGRWDIFYKDYENDILKND